MVATALWATLIAILQITEARKAQPEPANSSHSINLSQVHCAAACGYSLEKGPTNLQLAPAPKPGCGIALSGENQEG